MQTRIAEIEQDLISMLSAYSNSDKKLGPATDLIADLELESVRILEFVVDVEDRFDVVIDIESLSNVHTVNDFAVVVESLTAD